MKRCSGSADSDVQRCRDDSKMQRHDRGSRGVEMQYEVEQRCSDAVMQRCRDAEMQRCRDAVVQWCRGGAEVVQR